MVTHGYFRRQTHIFFFSRTLSPEIIRKNKLLPSYVYTYHIVVFLHLVVTTTILISIILFSYTKPIREQVRPWRPRTYILRFHLLIAQEVLRQYGGFTHHIICRLVFDDKVFSLNCIFRHRTSVINIIAE